MSLPAGPIIEVGPIAPGGHCVARLDGRVVFVRHALPGETVRIEITDATRDNYWLADAAEVLQPNPDRVESRCEISGSGGCGGCAFQHVSLAGQRRLKAQVVAEQLRRLAGIDWAGDVEPTPGDGLGWRTRMRYHVNAAGRAGLRRHHSTEIVPLPSSGCPIAHPNTPDVVNRSWPAGAELLAVANPGMPAPLVIDPTTSDRAATDRTVIDRAAKSTPITEWAAGRSWQVAADGFWQVHPGAADTLVDAVLAGLGPKPSESAFDLYCGVGLFAGALVAAGCRAWGVEGNREAISYARQNVPEARFSVGRVDKLLPKLPKRTDLIVLDPPRAGAGRRVIEAVAARRPRAIAYVACDPAALARDLKTAGQHRYRPVNIRAFDLFPMTHHVEVVAILKQCP